MYLNRQCKRQVISNFILHKYIRLSVSRCKYIKPIVEKYITRVKHNKQTLDLNNYLTHPNCMNELRKIAALHSNRPGGYCRIIKLGHRHGDSTEMAVLEIVDKNKIF